MIDAGRRPTAAELAVVVLAAAAVALPVGALAQGVPVAGQNVNMVSGTEWPGGDPFLQRDNEPSMAISSLDVERLLAGANTYRTVDLPFPADGTSETGDAWLGLYKSFDAGRTWKTYLLPGYPQDTSAEGALSPLNRLGLRAAADPTVRAGTNGFFAMSGIAFNRGTNNGVVFVSRFIDLNMKENGDAAAGYDTMPYVDTTVVDTGNAGQFLDKPWIAIDIPRPFASGTCTITANLKTKSASGDDTVTPVTRSFATGPMYVAWSRFTGSQSTKIMISRSLDCGRTWGNPVKVSEGNSINQGTALAIDPQSGAVYLAWRRFRTSSQTDAILVARSADGQTFANKDTREIASFIPFDQGTTVYSFRTSALPSIAVSVAGGTSLVHVAWAQRDTATGDARIVVSTSSDGGGTWGAPVKVDDGEAKDELGHPYQTDDATAPTLTRGHQVMPQVTFSAGRLMVLYYDLRLDHTMGVFEANEDEDGNFAADPETGQVYTETRKTRGELSRTEDPPDGHPDAVYAPYISDAPPTPTTPGLTIRRHTIDLRLAQFDPASHQWTSVPVSHYPFGTRGDRENEYDARGPLDQLQTNPPNLPLFQQGTVPFIGDYVDVVGETFYAERTATAQPWCAGVWCYRIAPTTADGQTVSPAFYATWTSNQDVRPPADGDWKHYTPVGGGGQSVYDPSQTTPACLVGQEGMRNQNIYMSRITEGLLVSSPQPSKPLSLTAERAFVVVVENATALQRAFRLRITNQPTGTGARASFLASTSTANGPSLCPQGYVPEQGPTSCTAIDVTIPPRSSVARSVFVRASNPSQQLSVDVNELDPANASSLLGGGLSGYLLLNAVPVPSLSAPDGSTSSDAGESYQPSISLINVSNPNVSNVNVSNVNVSNVNVSNVNVSNVNVSNVNVSNPDIADINVSNVNVSNVNVSNVNVSNVNVSNVNVSNAPISDANYLLTNEGNTAHSFHVKLVGDATAATGTNLQVIVSKPYFTPVSDNCTLGVEFKPVVLTSVPPEIVTPDRIGDPNIPDSSVANATVSLAPGEKAIVTVRGNTDVLGLTEIASRLTPAVVAHGATGGTGYSAVLAIPSSGSSLPIPYVGVAYSGRIETLGGTAPFTFTYTGSLPPGLTLEPDGTLAGTITGTPTTAQDATFTVTVTDSKGATASRTITLTVAKGPTTTSVGASPASAVQGQPVTLTANVGPDSSGTGAPVPTGQVTFSVDGAAISPSTSLDASGQASLVLSAGLPAGPHTVLAAYLGDSNYTGSSATLAYAVSTAPTSLTITSDSPDPSAPGEPVTVGVIVTAPSYSGAPTGTVSVSGGTNGGSCTITLTSASAGSGSCSLTPTTTGVEIWSATFTGDEGFQDSGPATTTHTVKVNKAPYAFTGFLNPLATALLYPQASLSGSWNFSRVLPIKWQLKDQSGKAVTSASAVRSLFALYSGATCSAGNAPPLPPATTDFVTLYTPAQGAAGGSDFRPGNTYNFNWDATKNARPGCWSIVLELDDGNRWATKVSLD